MDRNVNDNFKFNQETEFVPVLGLIAETLNKPSKNGENDKVSHPVDVIAASIQGNHHPALLSVLADELSVSSEEIHDFELYVKEIHRTFITHDVSLGTYMILNLLS